MMKQTRKRASAFFNARHAGMTPGVYSCRHNSYPCRHGSACVPAQGAPLPPLTYYHRKVKLSIPFFVKFLLRFYYKIITNCYGIVTKNIRGVFTTGPACLCLRTGPAFIYIASHRSWKKLEGAGAGKMWELETHRSWNGAGKFYKFSELENFSKKFFYLTKN